MLFCVSTVMDKNGPVGQVVLVEAGSFAGAFEKAAGLGLVTSDSLEVAALQLPEEEAALMLKHPDKWAGKILDAFEALTLIKAVMMLEGGTNDSEDPRS